MTADTPERCEPPPELRGVDGWHWVEAPAIKQLFIRRWWRARGKWCWADMDDRTLRSFHYLTPVTPPAEVEAIRAELNRCETACFDVQADNITLRAEVARLTAANDWQPIATAPLDVEGFVWVADGGEMQPNGKRGGRIAFGRVTVYADLPRKAHASGYSGNWRITHWRPLPPGPDPA